jgi:flagellar motor switch protein FliM
MSDDVLNPAEIESLLTAIEGSTGRHAAATSGAVSGPLMDSGTLRERLRVSPYDFKRPERVGKEQMRAVQTLHESLARNFGASLSALLRSIVEVKLISVDQLTYSEFVFSLENPTCFSLIEAKPLDSHFILDINPSILYPIIDRLLGGGREAWPLARRPLTDIELRLVSRITKLFLEELRRAWENVLVLDLALTKVESNPQLVQIVPPNEVVILIGFELTLGDARGMMNLCIPFNSIERIGGKLAANSWVGYSRKLATPETTEHITRELAGSLVEMVVHLANTKITTGDLLGLRVGDIITTEQDIRAPIGVCIEGQAKFRGRPGVYKGRKAVQIESVIAPRAGQT